MSHRCLKTSITILVFIALIISQSAMLGYAKSLIIATANIGGTYYPVGVSIATLISQKLGHSDNIIVTAVNSAGSGENIRMLKNGECDLAMLSGLYALQAFKGLGHYKNKPMQKMAAVAMLWNNVEHFAIRSQYVQQGDLKDLKGLKKAFSIGKRGSGTEGSTRVIFDALNIVEGQDYQARYLGYNPAITAIMDNHIAGAALPAGPPVAAVTQLFATSDEQISLLNISDQDFEKINKDYNLWKRYTIKAGTYPGQTTDIQTMAYPNLLVVSDRLTTEEVYKITKCIFENLPFFADIHHVTKAISLQNSLTGSPVPIHPGAAKYYREVGLQIPAP